MVKIVGYYGSWATYRAGDGRCRVKDINAKLCTHYIWSFLKISSNKVAFNNSDDESSLEAFVSHIREKNPNAKVMASVGGWTNSQGSEFSDMVSSQSKRRRFCESAVEFMNDYDLDGIDIDWEFPDEDDCDDFAEFVKVLSRHCDDAQKWLSVAVAGSTITANKAYDIPMISRYADFINLMTYDLHGHWDGQTGHHAGYYGAGNVQAIARYWTGHRCPKEKLILGIPTYGKTWTLRDSSEHGVGARANQPGKPGPYTQEAGVLAYYEILEKIEEEDGWKVRFDKNARSQYAYRGDQWISYEDDDSARVKARFIRDEELGGAMFWSLEMDDFKGIHGEKYPIVKTVWNVLC